MDLFIEQGYADTTTIQIADRAHVSERTLFRAFATKASLLWDDPFVRRFLDDLEGAPVVEATTARRVADAVLRSVHSLSDEEWQLNIRRRRVALSEPELVGVGMQSLVAAGDRFEAAVHPLGAHGEADVAAQPTPAVLFAWFALVGFARVPLTEATTREEWARALVRVVDLAAHGTLINRLLDDDPSPAARLPVGSPRGS